MIKKTVMKQFVVGICLISQQGISAENDKEVLQNAKSQYQSGDLRNILQDAGYMYHSTSVP